VDVSAPDASPPLSDTERERWDDLISDLLAEASATEDQATKVDCLREAAAIYERQLGDLPRALVAWEAAFAEVPTSDETGLAVERIASALGSWDEVLFECEAALARASDPPARAALLTWMARWLGQFLGQEAMMESHLLEALEVHPGAVAAAEALSELRRRQGDWGAAAEILSRAGECAERREEAVGLLLEAARIIHTRVGDAEAALQLYRRVLARDPRNAVAADALAETSGAVLDPGAICAQYREALDVDPENLEVVRQWGEVALQHGRLEDLRFLFELLHRRAGGGPANRRDQRSRLNDALDRFVAAHKWPEAVDVLQTLARESSGALSAKYFVAAGKIAQHELGDEALAVDLYDRALDADPEDARPFERLFALLSASHAWTQAEAALRRMIARLRTAGKGDDADTMIPWWRRLGDVRRTGTRDMAAASEAYRECVRLAPQDRYAKLVADLTAPLGKARISA
jgi:tetratricopeptide (TPR) repeat protein